MDAAEAPIGARPSASAPAGGSPGDQPGTPWAAAEAGRASSTASPVAFAPRGSRPGMEAPSLARLELVALLAGIENSCDPWMNEHVVLC